MWLVRCIKAWKRDVELRLGKDDAKRVSFMPRTFAELFVRQWWARKGSVLLQQVEPRYMVVTALNEMADLLDLPERCVGAPQVPQDGLHPGVLDGAGAQDWDAGVA